MSEYKDKENYIGNDETFYATHFQYTQVFERYKDKMFGKCADFGCNSGGQTIVIAREHKQITEVTAIDINETALNLLREKNIPNITCVWANFTSMHTILSDTFDCAYSFHSLEHIYEEDLLPSVKEFHRVLKQNAHILISIPYDTAYHTIGQHVSFFKEDRLKKLFEDGGFEIVEVIRDLADTLTLLGKATK